MSATSSRRRVRRDGLSAFRISSHISLLSACTSGTKMSTHSWASAPRFSRTRNAPQSSKANAYDKRDEIEREFLLIAL